MNGLVPQHIRRLSARGTVDPTFTGLLAGGGITREAVQASGSISGYPISGRQPYAKTGFTADLRDNSIGGPSLERNQLIKAFSIGADVQGLFNSLFMICDDDVTVQTWPGYQSWQMDSCAFYSIPIRGLNWIKVSSHRTFSNQMIFSSQPEPLMVFPISFHQERWATQTLTKTAAAGVADGWTSLAFVASDGGNQLDPALFGDTNGIHCGSIAAKNFITTAADNDINILIEGLNVSGKTWAADPTTSSAGITIADGDVSNAQTGRYYHLIRVRARVDAAVAATETAAITVQYRGYAGAF